MQNLCIVPASDKPEEHKKLVGKITDVCRDAACNDPFRIQNANQANIRLIEANRKYMTEDDHERADRTIQQLLKSKIRYDGSRFKPEVDIGSNKYR